MRLSALQRKVTLDLLTGCWNIRGFRELIALGVEDARANATDLAVCRLRVDNLEEVAEAAGSSNPDALTLMLAQVLRQRLPQNGALARLGPSDFCALVPAKSAIALEEELAKLSFPSATVNLPGSKLRLDIALSSRVSWLADLGPKAGAERLWAHALLTRA
jgi:GGDEF domain-containing protein